jgi:hypothetical protein
MSGSFIRCPDLFLNVRIRSLIVLMRSVIVLIRSQMSESVPACLDLFPSVRIRYRMSGSFTKCLDQLPKDGTRSHM